MTFLTSTPGRAYRFIIGYVMTYDFTLDLDLNSITPGDRGIREVEKYVKLRKQREVTTEY